nr:glycosyltransferase [Mycobacterium sp. IDR2000157661]
MSNPVAAESFSEVPSFAILSTYPPTPCGLATFSSALAEGLVSQGAEVGIVRLADGDPTTSGRVIGEYHTGSPSSVSRCADLLNRSDVAVIQHEYGIYGGRDGDEVVDVLDGLRVPSIVIAHTVLRDPTRHQRMVLKAVAARADQLIAMSQAATERLRAGFGVESGKITTIPHGATVPMGAYGSRGSRPTVLTWGLLGPGKGVERVIEAMRSLRNLPGRPRYVVAGRTHPKVLAADGEAYRAALVEQARACGVADSVVFDTGYRNVAMLMALARSAAVVVLPYDSPDQVTSGVLVDAIASGRPVVATAFPHAVELLASGAGIVVDHDDPEALEAALRRVLTQPRLAGAMAAEARRLAPEMAWPIVARTYVDVAQRLLAQRQTRR